MSDRMEVLRSRARCSALTAALRAVLAGTFALPLVAGETHWSLRPVERPPLPVLASADADRPANPVDVFLLARLRDDGLSPSPRADARTLARRLFLDVIGLPPEPSRIEAFARELREHGDAAWQRLVDEVLASPSHGERWARHWLDVVRFAETHGFETNRERPNAYHYRDWVIRALNEDRPYDIFVRDQIAGDARGEDVATGFLVAGCHDLVKSPDINLTLMQRQDELADIVNAVGTSFLGMTLGCARCHDHKFDAVTQKDYYSLQAVFAGVQHGDREASTRRDSGARREIARVQARLSAIDAELRERGTLEPVNAKRNEERFDPVVARAVRMTVRRTNGGEPCIDELEVFDASDPTRNVALSSAGATARSSGDLQGFAIHKLSHLNDGKYGNSNSWIASTASGARVEVELSEPVCVDRIVWGRDREGQYLDRVAVDYVFEVLDEEGGWRVAASSAQRLPFGSDGEVSARPAVDSKAVERLLREKKRLGGRLARLTGAYLVYAGKFEQPGATHVLYRGEPGAKRDEVGPDTIAALGELGLERGAAERERRGRLAEWITRADNPLTARVLVNRIWHYHFGTGIVATPNDFGGNGARPTHPELLDWLASELVASGWSLKHIHRLILTSRAYRQSSRSRPEAAAVDGDARLLWRFPSRRLEAEPIRDSMLAVSGSLNRRAGGPGFSVFRVQPENVRHYFPKETFGPDEWRRAIYMTKVRQEQDDVFGVFDCPDGNQTVPARSRSTTALQALNLLNGAFVLQQAERFAERVRRLAGEDADSGAHVEVAFRLALGRAPEAAELEVFRGLAAEHGLAAVCRGLFNANEFLFLP